MMPGITNALGGMGELAPYAANALRGGITSAAGGGDPLQGALLGTLMASPMGKSVTSGAENMARSVTGTQTASSINPNGVATGTAGGAPSMWGNNSLVSAQPATMGGDAASINPNTGYNMAAATGAPTMPGAAPQQSGSSWDNYMKDLMKPSVVVPALASYGMGMYQTAQAKDLAQQQLALARSQDTGLGVRQQAAGYASDPSTIPGSPGYMESEAARRRALMRLAAARGGLQGGALPGQLADASGAQMQDWWKYYSQTANGSAPSVQYPNYQNSLRG
jgi:hypothetical protein